MTDSGTSNTPVPREARPPIVLMGLRGSGKSSAGEVIARELGGAFVDLDDRTASRLNARDAAEAIGIHGISAFRQAETASLVEAIEERPGVLALGGGTPTAPGAADLLRRASSDGQIELIYLHTPVEALRDRLEKTDTSTRPSLTGKGTLDEIAEMYDARDPLYRDLATRVIETEGRTLQQIAGIIASTI